jgi:hypothetical protein
MFTSQQVPRRPLAVLRPRACLQGARKAKRTLMKNSTKCCRALRGPAMCAFVSLLALAAATALPAASIVVGNRELLPTTPNQHVEIFITGGDKIDGMDLAAEVGSGNQVHPPNAIDGPTITAVDVIGHPGFNPTIFTGNNDGGDVLAGPPGPTKRTVENGTISLLPDGGTNYLGHPTYYSVTANGLFATLVFDTTGIFALPVQQSRQLLLGGPNHNSVRGFSSSDIGVDEGTNPDIIGDTRYPNIIDGTVFIADPAPEPGSLSLAAIALVGLLAWGWRRKRG